MTEDFASTLRRGSEELAAVCGGAFAVTGHSRQDAPPESVVGPPAPDTSTTPPVTSTTPPDGTAEPSGAASHEPAAGSPTAGAAGSATRRAPSRRRPVPPRASWCSSRTRGRGEVLHRGRGRRVDLRRHRRVPARSPGLCRRARDPGAARRALGRLPRPAVTRRKARPASRGACRTAPTRVPSPGVVIRPRWPAGNRPSAVPAVRLVGDPLDEGAAERGEPVLRRCARAQWRRTAGVGVVELALDVVEQGEQQSVAVAEPAEERALADARHPTRWMAGTPSSGRIGETRPRHLYLGPRHRAARAGRGPGMSQGFRGRTRSRVSRTTVKPADR